MALLDLMLSSFHFPVLDVTFLSLFYSAGEYKKWQELKGSVLVACLCHCCECGGQDTRRWGI